MKTPFKFRIFIASLLLWIVANPTSAQQIGIYGSILKSASNNRMKRVTKI